MDECENALSAEIQSQSFMAKYFSKFSWYSSFSSKSSLWCEQNFFFLMTFPHTDFQQPTPNNLAKPYHLPSTPSTGSLYFPSYSLHPHTPASATQSVTLVFLLGE